MKLHLFSESWHESVAQKKKRKHDYGKEQIALIMLYTPVSQTIIYSISLSTK